MTRQIVMSLLLVIWLVAGLVMSVTNHSLSWEPVVWGLVGWWLIRRSPWLWQRPEKH